MSTESHSGKTGYVNAQNPIVWKKKRRSKTKHQDILQFQLQYMCRKYLHRICLISQQLFHELLCRGNPSCKIVCHQKIFWHQKIVWHQEKCSHFCKTNNHCRLSRVLQCAHFPVELRIDYIEPCCKMSRRFSDRANLTLSVANLQQKQTRRVI